MGKIIGKIVRCVETGRCYPSIQAASRATGISASNLCAYLKYGMTGTRGGYHWEVVESKIFPTGHKVYCVETGETFVDQAEAAQRIGVTRAAVSTAMKQKRPVKGYTFERLRGNNG